MSNPIPESELKVVQKMSSERNKKFSKMKPILRKLFSGWYILLLLAISCYLFLILVMFLT